MASAFTFNPIQSDAPTGAALYQSSAYQAGSNDVWCGFFIPSGITTAVPLSASDSWNASYGCYIFSAVLPDENFLQNLIQYRASLNTVPIVQSYRFVFWFINPDPGAAMLNADQSIPFVANMQSASGYTTAQHVSYLFSTISVEIDSGTVLGLQQNDDGSSALYISNNNPKALQLKGASNTSFLGQFLTPVQIQFEGGETGRLAYQTSMILQQLNINNDFEMLDVSLRYFYNTAAAVPGPPMLTQQRYRLFGISPAGGATVSLNVNMDVFYPLTPASTFFTFIPDSGQTEMITLNTYFSTSGGQFITLTPLVNGASLVFAMSRDVNGNPMYYLTPSGDFTVGGITGSASPVLLCGLSGTETISLNNGSILSFSSGQAAFVNQFPLPEVTGNTSAQLLTSTYTTAWVGVKNAAPVKNVPLPPAINYVSQATGAAIYTNNQQVQPYLGYFPALTANLAVATVYYPLVPYGYIQPSTPVAAQLVTTFETQVISTTRKSIIAVVARSEQTAPKAGDTIVTGTTPQGLLIQLDTSTTPNTWEQLTIANNSVTDSTYTLQFENVTPPLQSALQSNQLFLVVSTGKNLGTLTPESNINPDPGSAASLFYNLMSIQGWPFTLNVPVTQQPGNYNNVLIFKFCSGALIDRVAQSSLWTAASDFNDTTSSPGSLNTLSSWISKYIHDGVDQYTQNGDTNFANFYDIVTSPTWNGVLALNVDIDVQEFPSQLQGLLGGIDMSLFRAHHFGVNINMVTNAGDVLSMEPKSSLFGLINYIDPYYPNEPADTTDDFAFKVLFLKVLFENSCIDNFQSKIQLTINKFFGSGVLDETTEGTEDTSHTLILDGHYENHNGVPAYSFTETGDNIFNLDNNILTGVEIVKSSFATLVPQNSDSDTMVNSCFSLWGFMNFNSLPGFDSFSFGPEATDPFYQNGLSFSNLNIRMSFDMNTPSVKTMRFDPSQIAFDTVVSNSRMNSLYAHFPIKLTGLVSGDQNTTPASLGFLPLSVASLTGASAPSGSWYGLTYTLDLGTPGALAADAGFVATVLLTWGTDSLAANTSLGTMAGLKIPGASAQSKLLSLQNVLKLDFGSLELSVQENSTAYILTISDIALKFLGLKIPSGDKFNFMLFGDPGAASSPTSLGWFAAYNNS